MNNLSEIRELVVQLEKLVESTDLEALENNSPIISQMACLKEALSGISAEQRRIVGTVIGDGQVKAGGDIVAGDKTVINLSRACLVESSADADALADYLLRVRNACNDLHLSEIDSQTTMVVHSPMRLSEVFVVPHIADKVAYGEDRHGNKYRIPLEELSTTNVEIVGDWDLVPMTASDFVNRHGRVVLLGDIGSGKTAFVDHLMYALATSTLSSDKINLEHLGLGRLGNETLVPIKIAVSEFVTSSHFSASAKGVLDYIQSDVGILSGATSSILRAIRRGKAFIAFDGLDVIDESLRLQVMRAVVELNKSFPKNRYLVTCRTLEYEAVKVTSVGEFHVATLAPFDQQQIRAFIYRWYSGARNRYPHIQGNAEKTLIDEVKTPDLAILARTPLLLTQIALLYSSYGRLPEDKVNLYDEVVKLLLSRWKKDTPVARSLVDYLGIPASRLMTLEPALLELAYSAYEKQGTQPISKGDVIDVLKKYFDEDWGKIQKFCEYVSHRAGLLVEQNGKYCFPHATFQEFLAAKYLSLQNDFASRIADLVTCAPNKWRSVFSMAVKIAGVDRGIMAINSLCYESPPRADELADFGTTHWKKVLIAAEAVLGLNPIEIEQRPERVNIFNRIVDWLLVFIKHDGLDVQDRVIAGNILGQLGDPRPGVASLEPDLAVISKGPVLINPPHIAGKERLDSYEFEIVYDYWIARYPVTQTQYSLFIAENPEYHLPDGIDSYDWNPDTRTPPLERSNHPVVLVSWYDAKQYCEWLQGKLEELGLLPGGYEVRLPIEPEWEKGAHGGIRLPDGTPNPMPDRRYPWGHTIGPGCANLRDLEPEIFETTPVGIFPAGASPSGILDMAGNAMEWIQTSWGNDDVDNPGFSIIYNAHDGRESEDASGFRILRGGSWLFPEGEAQCSCRLDPNVRFADVGMRIVIAPRVP